MLRKIVSAFISGLLMAAVSAQAVPSPAVTFTDTASPTFVSVAETVGWNFTVLNPISVESLGVFDSDLDGLVSSHDVGIWDNANNLLTSATVQAGTANPLLNQFRYATIIPLQLGVGTYTIGATWGFLTGSDDYIANVSNFATIPDITYLNSVYIQAVSLTRPTTDANFFSNGIFGPNFGAQPIPEPGTFMLLGAGILGLVICRKRWNNMKS